MTVELPARKLPLRSKRAGPDVPLRVMVEVESLASRVPAEPMTSLPVVRFREVPDGFRSMVAKAEPVLEISTVEPVENVPPKKLPGLTIKVKLPAAPGFTKKLLLKAILLPKVYTRSAVRVGDNSRL